MCIRWLRHTRNRVLSTKLMPVHFPNRHFFTKMTNCTTTDFSSSVNLLYETVFGAQMPVSPTYLVQIKVFEALVVGTVEHYHDDNDLCL